MICFQNIMELFFPTYFYLILTTFLLKIFVLKNVFEMLTTIIMACPTLLCFIYLFIS